MRRCACLFWLAAACGQAAEPPPPAPATPPSTAPGQRAPLAIDHDFGVIPHGESRAHEFPLDLAAIGGDYVPLRVHFDCACGRAELLLRGGDGAERFVDGAGTATSRPAAGEALVLRLVLDTARTEALDLKPTQSRGFVVLQALGDMTGASRVQWPLTVRYAIDAPVELRPLATLDFGRVAASQRGLLVTTLRGDDRHGGARFGPATSSDPLLTVELVEADGHWLLRARCAPGEFGSHRARVDVATTIPGYQLALEAAWKSIPDLEAVPLDKVSLRADLAREQTEEEAVGQFVLVVDHDERRPVGFVVQRVVDADGRDVAGHFAIRFEPVVETPRRLRMHVRYAGGLAAGVRATAWLSKQGDAGPFLPIQLVLFAR